MKVARKVVEDEAPARPVLKLARVAAPEPPVVPVESAPVAEAAPPAAEAAAPVEPEPERRGLFRRFVDAVRGPEPASDDGSTVARSVAEPETPSGAAPAPPALAGTAASSDSPVTSGSAPTLARSAAAPTPPGGASAPTATPSLARDAAPANTPTGSANAPASTPSLARSAAPADTPTGSANAPASTPSLARSAAPADTPTGSANAPATPSLARTPAPPGEPTPAAAPSLAPSAAGPSLARSAATPSLARAETAADDAPAADADAPAPTTGDEPAADAAPLAGSDADVARFAQAGPEDPAPQPTVAEQPSLARSFDAPMSVAGAPGPAATRALARQATASKRIASRAAAAPAPAEAPLPPARPHLQLVETPQPERTLATKPAAAEQPHPDLDTPAAPTLARSAAERLADATGGSIESGEGGLRTVNFPPPVSLQQPYTVSRELAAPEAEGAQTTTVTAESPSGPGHSGAPAPQSPEDKAREREELYEYFLDRFKRDLLIEREQMGHLIIDNP